MVGFGGDYARLRTDCHLVGRGATGDLAAAFFGDGDQTLDYRTFQDHVAEDTTSNLLFKGAVSDRSRSIYTGLIRVGKGARGANAFQTNRNLKLSEGAWAESIPNLRDREQRRPLQPRVGRRARSTRSSASTSRAAACPRWWPSG